MKVQDPKEENEQVDTFLKKINKINIIQTREIQNF